MTCPCSSHPVLSSCGECFVATSCLFSAAFEGNSQRNNFSSLICTRLTSGSTTTALSLLLIHVFLAQMHPGCFVTLARLLFKRYFWLHITCMLTLIYYSGVIRVHLKSCKDILVARFRRAHVLMFTRCLLWPTPGITARVCPSPTPTACGCKMKVL